MDESRAERMARSKRVIAAHGPELVRRYEAGESLPTLAREFDLYVGTVSNVIKRLGGTVRTHNPQLARSRAATVAHGPEMVRRYLAGERASTVGADYGVSHGTVLRLVREAGGEVRKRGYGSIAPPVGAENPAYRGGIHLRHGYRAVLLDPSDPLAANAREGRSCYMLEHRLVMARAIGRALEPDETVHHINGDKLDNRLENLQLRTGRHGKGVHLRCHDCGSQNVGPVEL